MWCILNCFLIFTCYSIICVDIVWYCSWRNYIIVYSNFVASVDVVIVCNSVVYVRVCFYFYLSQKRKVPVVYIVVGTVNSLTPSILEILWKIWQLKTVIWYREHGLPVVLWWTCMSTRCEVAPLAKSLKNICSSFSMKSVHTILN